MRSIKTLCRRSLVLSAAVTGVLAASASAQSVWIGDPTGSNVNNNDWNLASNWNPSGVPNSTTANVLFDGSQSNVLGTPWLRFVDGLNATVNTLTFDSAPVAFFGHSGNTADVRYAAWRAFWFNGGNITFGGVAPSIIQNGRGAAQLNQMTMTTAGLTLGGNGPGQVRVAGTFTGAAGTLTKVGNSRFSLSNMPTTAGFKVVVEGGELRYTGDINPGSLVTDFITLNGGRLQVTNTDARTIGANAGIRIGPSSGSGWGIIGYPGTSGTSVLNINSVIANNGSGTGNLHLIGPGVQGRIALNGANTYTGSTRVENVILELNYGSSTAGRLSDTAELRLDGGRVWYSGNTSTAVTEAVSGLTLGRGLNTVVGYSSAAPATTGLSVGAITRETAGVLGFQRSGNQYELVTTTSNGFVGNSGAILAGWATVSTAAATAGNAAYTPTDWAQVDANGRIVPLASYNNNSVNANDNSNITAATTATSNVTLNSLRIAGANLAVNTGVNLVINSGGVLVTTGHTVGTTADQGTLTSGNGTDLVIWANESTTINTRIVDNGSTPIGLTVIPASNKSITLTGANTFTGDVNILGHYLTVGSQASANVGAGNRINIGMVGGGTTNAAQLRFNNNQAADKTLSQDIYIYGIHQAGDAAIRTATGAFGNANFDLSLDGNIVVDTITTASATEADAAEILVLRHEASVDSSVRIGGPTVGTKTFSGATRTNQNTFARFQLNPLGIRSNTLAGGITNLAQALTINSTIQDGSGGGGLSLLLETPDTGRSGLAVAVINGNNTFSGAGIGAAGSLPGTNLSNVIVLAGHDNALSSGPVQLARVTGGQPANQKQGLLTNAGLTIANNIGLGVSTGYGTNGALIAESFIGGNTAGTSNYTGRIDWHFDLGNVPSFAPYVGSGNVASMHALVLTQVPNGRSNFSGPISSNVKSDQVSGASLSPVIIAGGGEVRLSNTGSRYVGQTIVRNGTLLVAANAPSGAAGALGEATSPIQLGDVRTTAGSGTVRVATVQVPGGTYTFNPTGGSNGNGLLTWSDNFSTSDNAWDGVTLALDDLVLIKDFSGTATGSGTGNPAINGIYRVVNTGASTAKLERVATADVDYGRYVDVQQGRVWGGKRFYQGYGGTGTTVTINATPLAWMLDDTQYNAALLTDGPVTIARPIRVNAGSGSRVLGGYSDHNSTFSGAITLDRNVQLTSVTTGSRRTTFSGLIDDGSGSFGVEKTGSGVVELTAANTYDGGTTVSAGTLLVNNTSGSGTGTGTVTVNSGATLGGNGTISGAVNVNTGGTLAPGNSIGTLSTGALTLAGTYHAEVDASTTTADRINVTGSVSLGTLSVLNVSLTGSLTSGQTFTIIDNDDTDAVTGTFNGLAEGAIVLTSGGYHLRVSYNSQGSGNDVVLYTSPVPEPASLSLLALGALALRRRR